MSSRKRRASIAQETLQILAQGYYQTQRGQQVSLASEQRQTETNTMLYRTEVFSELPLPTKRPFNTVFELHNATSLHIAHQLWQSGERQIMVLNFASAKNPGGGFLNGSQAQEESLARASGLYNSLITKREMYDYNRARRTCLYSDYMIYSPQVPVFRDDEDELLDTPYLINFITSPAVNRNCINNRKDGESHKEILQTMRQRTERILQVAWQEGNEVLVLGAWGCGVFSNNPHDIAKIFAETLQGNGAFAGVFRKVVFAVLDRSKKAATFEAFKLYFG